MLSAAYQRADKPDTSDRLNAIDTVGAGYTMGTITGKLNYLRGENRDAATRIASKVDVIGAGLDWRTALNNTASVALYYGKGQDNNADKSSTLILSDGYSLSKRTMLYGQLAYARADLRASLMTSVVLTGTQADKNTTLLNVGIKHLF